MRAHLSFRAVRAGVFAAVCTALGMVAHVFGGGPVSVATAAVALGLGFAGTFVLAGRERSFGAVLALLTGLQAVQHLLFSVAHAHRPAELPHHVHSALSPEAGMLAMHGWAVVLTALWLARGEALLWTLLRRLGTRLLLVLLVLVDPARTVPPVRHVEQRPRPRPVVLPHALSRRGPPLVAVNATG